MYWRGVSLIELVNANAGHEFESEAGLCIDVGSVLLS